MLPFWSGPGQISPSGCWVWFCGCYMYSGRTLCSLAWQVVTEWEHDRHLVG